MQRSNTAVGHAIAPGSYYSSAIFSVSPCLRVYRPSSIGGAPETGAQVAEEGEGGNEEADRPAGAAGRPIVAVVGQDDAQPGLDDPQRGGQGDGETGLGAQVRRARG